MMMTRTFINYCLILLLSVGTASAADTTQTPTPAQVIASSG